VNEQLAGWIRENQSKGYDSDQIKAYLIQQGYAQAEVEEAIGASDSVGAGSASLAKNAETAPSWKSKYLKKKTVIPLAVILLLAIAIGVFFMIPSQQPGTSTGVQIAAAPPTENCFEDWTCSGEWGACESGTQTMTCIDNNKCNTTVLKPLSSRQCQAAEAAPAPASSKNSMRMRIKSGLSSNLMGKMIFAEVLGFGDQVSFDVNGETFILDNGKSKTLGDGSVLRLLSAATGVSSDGTPSAYAEIEITGP